MSKEGKAPIGTRLPQPGAHKDDGSDLDEDDLLPTCQDPDLQRWLLKVLRRQEEASERNFQRLSRLIERYMQEGYVERPAVLLESVQEEPVQENIRHVAPVQEHSRHEHVTPSLLAPVEHNECPVDGAAPWNKHIGPSLILPGAGLLTQHNNSGNNSDRNGGKSARPPAEKNDNVSLAPPLLEANNQTEVALEVSGTPMNSEAAGEPAARATGSKIVSRKGSAAASTESSKFERMAMKPSLHKTDSEIEEQSQTRLQWFMGTPLDIIAGLLILINTLVMFMQLQYEGYKVRVLMHLEPAGGWPHADAFFRGFEYFFASVFLIELIVRVGYFKCAFFMDMLNILDAVVVAITSSDTFIFPHIGGMNGDSGGNLIFARIIRNAKLVRTLRFVRAVKLCHHLRVLIKTILASFMALIWSMMILFGFMLMSALFMCQTLQEFMKDLNNPLDDREWVEKNYGSAAKALWTMFEITFSGGWPTWVRPVIEKVSVWYAVFFTGYVGFVVFAVIRIITALFLKDTLSVASQDQDMMMQQKMKEKAGFAAKLEKVFHEADQGNNGFITWPDFQELLSRPTAKAYLASLEMETHEIESMFALLDDGDGMISFDEFLQGVLRIKGQARSLDVLTLLHNNKKIMDRLTFIQEKLQPGVSKLRGSLQDKLGQGSLPKLASSVRRGGNSGSSDFDTFSDEAGQASI